MLVTKSRACTRIHSLHNREKCWVQQCKREKERLCCHPAKIFLNIEHSKIDNPLLIMYDKDETKFRRDKAGESFVK